MRLFDLADGNMVKTIALDAVAGGSAAAPHDMLHSTDVSYHGMVRDDPRNRHFDSFGSSEGVFWPDIPSLDAGNALYFTASKLNSHFAGTVKDGQER